MSEITNEDVVKALGNLTVLEMIALTKELEAKWGVEAKPAVVSNPPCSGCGQVWNGPHACPGRQEAQTEFTVILLPVSVAAKMNTIKLVRELLTIGLKEAKEFVEGAPKALKEGVTREEAAVMVARLNDVGATTEVK
jgi:large subunit ribosomal protein L7/L12